MKRAAVATAGAMVVGALSLGSGGARGAPVHVAALGQEAEPIAALTPALCPPGSLPDGEACVRLPRDDDEGPEEESSVNAHHDKRGRWIVYDQIPRRPDRAADYDAYRYPVACHPSQSARSPSGRAGDHCVASGYDLDRPDDAQRRGRRLSHVGHGGVDIPQAKGTPITMLALEHQEGDAEVVYVGPFFGTTVITRHTLREGGQLRDYVLLFGHLDAVAPGVTLGTHLREGDGVGTVGDTGSPELVHLHLEARRMREGADASKLAPGAMFANENSVVCDPRNVLPLR